MFRTITGRSQTATGMPHRARSKVTTASCVVALLGLGGCATTHGPKPMTAAEEGELAEEIETLADRAGKLNDLAFPILASNVEACGKRVRPSIGASWITEADLGGWPNERRAVAKRHFGVSRRPVLDHVVDGGPAAEGPGPRRNADSGMPADSRSMRFQRPWAVAAPSNAMLREAVDRPHRNKDIRESFNGRNYRELARRHRLSHRQVGRIVDGTRKAGRPGLAAGQHL